MATIAVYCGSLTPTHYPNIVHGTRIIGAELAQRGDTILYGGSAKGLMGEMAKAAIAHNGTVLGYTPPGMRSKEPPLHGITPVPCNSLEDRRSAFRQADGHLVLTGGGGTAEEFFHVFNAMCFGEWQLQMDETIPPRPIGIVADDGHLMLPLYQFLMNGAYAGTVNERMARWVKYANWRGMREWFYNHLDFAREREKLPLVGSK